MSDIENRILKAQQSSKEMDSLIAEYLPFIKKQLSKLLTMGLEFDDMLSIAMLTFVGCVKQYSEGKGAFLHFTAVSIRNRIIDESRKQHKYTSKITPLYPSDEKNTVQTIQDCASIVEYSKEQERQGLCEEIALLSSELIAFNIKFAELPTICPKQDRSRKQCIKLATAITQDEIMRKHLKKNHHLLGNELAQRFNISAKTVEKHKKYIITIAILLMGDYPSIKAFLPQYKEVM